jgi:hypothetical protein
MTMPKKLVRFEKHRISKAMTNDIGQQSLSHLLETFSLCR